MKTIDDFIKEFKPITNPLNPLSAFNGCLYETYGDELNLVSNTYLYDTSRKIWTLVEEDGDTFIISGYQIINRLGYFITEIPLPKEIAFEVFDVESEQGDENYA